MNREELSNLTRAEMQKLARVRPLWLVVPARLWLNFASSLCAQRDNLNAKGTKETMIDALIEKHDPFPVPPYVREPFTV